MQEPLQNGLFSVTYESHCEESILKYSSADLLRQSSPVVPMDNLTPVNDNLSRQNAGNPRTAIIGLKQNSYIIPDTDM